MGLSRLFIEVLVNIGAKKRLTYMPKVAVYKVVALTTKETKLTGLTYWLSKRISVDK